MTTAEALQKLLDHSEKVRTLQKQYFQTRDKVVLQQSKTAEKELDNVIYNLKQIFPK